MPLKIMLKEMYENLKDDILITIEKNIIEPKISKKFALIDEIEAIQKNRKAEEIVTDRVFLSWNVNALLEYINIEFCSIKNGFQPT